MNTSPLFRITFILLGWLGIGLRAEERTVAVTVPPPVVHGGAIEPLAALVNPMIGVVGPGSTMPGPSRPHGSIHPSPQTLGNRKNSGYGHTQDITGFAQLHAIDEKEEGFFPGLAQMAARAAEANTGTLVLTNAGQNPILADMQVREAKAAGVGNVVSAQMGMMLELPLTSRAVNVRAL